MCFSYIKENRFGSAFDLGFISLQNSVLHEEFAITKNGSRGLVFVNFPLR